MTLRPSSGFARVASMILSRILRCRVVRSESGSHVLSLRKRCSVLGVNGDACAGRKREDFVGVRGVRGDAGKGLRAEAEAGPEVEVEAEAETEVVEKGPGPGTGRFAAGSSSMSLVAGRRVGVLGTVVLGPDVGGGVVGLALRGVTGGVRGEGRCTGYFAFDFDPTGVLFPVGGFSAGIWLSLGRLCSTSGG